MDNNYDNNIPHCQNTMFPNFFHNPYYYQPLINIPSRTSIVTVGEVAASVDMLKAQVAEISTRMDSFESILVEFKNSVSNDIFLLKNTLFEHSTELLNVRECVEDTRTHVNKIKDVVEEQNECVDELSDAVQQSISLYKKQQKTKVIASKIDLGMIRRRLSKVEDFTNEFYEQFESFKNVKGIITCLSDHINECDRDISIMITNKNEKIHCHANECDSSKLNDYFSNYNSDCDVSNVVDKNIGNSVNFETSNDSNYNNEEQEQEQEIVIKYDDI